nr:hypothetical protein [Tanacetum cinerariifolium]
IMDSLRAQKMALDETLVATTNRPEIGKGNQRLSLDLKSNEATIQVVLDALKLTLLNGKSHTLNMENFRDMLNICPRLPRERFQDPLVKEEIISFLSDLGHSREIKVLTDVNVNSMHQPWRSFAAIINRCLSGKGMYTMKHVDYVSLLWEDLVYQVENKNAKKNNDIQDMLESKAYKEYYAFASGSFPLKAKTTYKKKAKEPVTSKTAFESVSKVDQLKLTTKRSKKDFHISHASGSGDGVGKLSKVLDEQEKEDIGTDEGTDTLSGVPDVPKYESENNMESWGDSEEEGDDDDDGNNDDKGGNDDEGDDVAESDNEQTEYENDDDGSNLPRMAKITKKRKNFFFD